MSGSKMAVVLHQREGREGGRKKALSRSHHWYLGSHLIEYNLVTRLPQAAREAGKCSFYTGNLCAQLNLRVILLKEG